MNRARLAASAALSVALLLALSGCSRAIKQAYYEFRGAKSEIILISDFDQDPLGPYRSVRFEPVTTTVGDKICPPRLRRYYDQHARELLADLRAFYPGGDPALRIASEILYFQHKGLLSGAECLTRVRMHDDADQRLVLDAIVRTESKSFRAGDESALAESNVKAIGKLLKKRKLEEEEEEEGEEEEEQDD